MAVLYPSLNHQPSSSAGREGRPETRERKTLLKKWSTMAMEPRQRGWRFPSNLRGWF